MRYFALVLYLFQTAIALSKEIDLRRMQDADGDYNVAFCSRPSPAGGGLPGHAFVSFSHVTPGGDRDFLAIGHTVSAGVGPVEAGWSYFGGPVTGLLKPELYTSVKQNCLDVLVNKADYLAARAFIANPLHTLGLAPADGTVFQAYKLGSEDCMAFVIAVANSLAPRGLKVPPRNATELPQPYIARLNTAN